MNPIAPNSAVTLHFTIKLKDGSLADSTHNQGKPAKLVMGDGSLSSNFEQCLLGMLPGEKNRFLSPRKMRLAHLILITFIIWIAVSLSVAIWN